MANFKLYLLNLKEPVGENTKPVFLHTPISEFSNEHTDMRSYGYATYSRTPEELSRGIHLGETSTIIQNPHFCYSYNEKFQHHQNNQRTLTFSMDRRITREDRIEDNPFIYYLHAGAQLLLVDKYDNHHLMTVTKTSFTFKEFNTIYDFECQDSFSYQCSRQNSG